MAKKLYKKTGNKTYEIQGILPTETEWGKVVLTDTTQTITGAKTFNAPPNVIGKEIATTIFKTSNGGQLIIGKEGPNSGTMLRFDQVAGTPRLRLRTFEMPGKMIWSQPEKGSELYFDLTNSAGVSTRTILDARGGTIARTSDIGNGTITIKKNSKRVNSFNLNSSGNTDIDLDVSGTFKISGSSGFNDDKWHYRKIGHFIFNSSDVRNGAPVHISGVIGSWAQEKMIFDIFVSTRGGLNVNGFVRGRNSSCRLVMDNNEYPNIFLAVYSYAMYNITVDTFDHADSENNAIKGSFHRDWYAEDDIFTDSNSVTVTPSGYKNLLSLVCSQRAAYSYTGAFSETNGTQTKLAEVNGGATGKIICVHGYIPTTGEVGQLSIQRRTTFYTDYDCIAIGAGAGSGAYLSCTGVVPPSLQYDNTSIFSRESIYYIFGKNVSNVYIITFDLP